MSNTTTTEKIADPSEADNWSEAMAEQEAGENNVTEPTKEKALDTPPSENKSGNTNIQSGNFSGTPSANASVFKDLASESISKSTSNDIDLILDIPVQLTVELGRTKIAIKNLLQLAQGSVVELDGLAGEPMDVLVNGCLIAQGEVVVVNDKFGIRLTDIITPSERIRKLNR
ncbi:flagellar motor switch protein FliN [Nitrosomonas aestuarii]|uniref:flagellar motor switch protein FliN n=1 Tax=Nitrosomonas aestuarii TaxID=52441 RepID=UPI000D301479|nr:flagellar motor switch protein FliN [Nitrosomonas aestuarii]PTN13153.1 flagellar motor switch protein FliN [Nitrosomonas aestuarii]